MTLPLTLWTPIVWPLFVVEASGGFSGEACTVLIDRDVTADAYNYRRVPATRAFVAAPEALF